MTSFGPTCRCVLALALLSISIGCQTDCIMICRQVVLRPHEAALHHDPDWEVISRPVDDHESDRRE